MLRRKLTLPTPPSIGSPPSCAVLLPPKKAKAKQHVADVWVQHIENALVVNAGDSLEFLSGGLYRATIHRVVRPPEDQQQYSRLGVFYFTLPNDDVALAPLADSPVLKELGIKRRPGLSEEHPPNVAAWRKERTRAYGTSRLVKKENGDEEEVINGVVVRHYN